MRETRMISLKKEQRFAAGKETGRSRGGWAWREGWRKMSVSEEFPRTYKQITQPDAPSRSLSWSVTASYVRLCDTDFLYSSPVRFLACKDVASQKRVLVSLLFRLVTLRPSLLS